MTDLIMDTNSLPILADVTIVETIIQKCDSLYVPRCVEEKEFPNVPALAQFRYSVERARQKL
jgi:hypothetical protein